MRKLKKSKKNKIEESYEVEGHNPRLKQSILRGVNEQLNSKEAPYVKEIFNKLIDLGLNRDEAKIKIGEKLTIEMYTILKNQESFNEDRYKKLLNEIFEEI